MLLTQAEWEACQKRSAGEGSRKNRSHDGGGSNRGRGRGRGGSNGGRGGHGDGSAKQDKSHIKCFKCHLYGHYANWCPGEDKKDEKKKDEAHHARTVEYEPIVLLAETGVPELLKETERGSLLSDGYQAELNLNEVKTVLELRYTNSDG